MLTKKVGLVLAVVGQAVLVVLAGQVALASVHPDQVRQNLKNPLHPDRVAPTTKSQNLVRDLSLQEAAKVLQVYLDLKNQHRPNQVLRNLKRKKARFQKRNMFKQKQLPSPQRNHM